MRTLVNTQRDDAARKIMLGATGLALAAGAVATGFALSNPKNRRKLRTTARRAEKGLRRVGEVIEEGRNRYQAIAHRISAVSSRNRRGMRRGRRKGRTRRAV